MAIDWRTYRPLARVPFFDLWLKMRQYVDLWRAARRILGVDRGGDGHHDRRLAVARRRIVLNDGNAAVILRLGGLALAAAVVLEVVLQVGDVVVVLLRVAVDDNACLNPRSYISES